LDAEREIKVAAPDVDASTKKKRAKRAPDTHVANALRSAYQETVRENVPDEFLDLLGKLS
jgi:hypothetical protein